MVLFVNDTFTDSDATSISAHTGETGASWTALTGNSHTPTIRSNAVAATGSSGASSLWYASGTPTDADYSVTATYVDVFFISGVGARMSTSAQTGYFGLLFNNSARLYKYVAGTLTEFGTAVAHGLTTGGGVGVTMTLACSGTTIALTVQRSSDSNYLASNGTWQAGSTAAVTATDSAITAAGRAGFWQAGGAASTTPALTALSADGAAAVDPPVTIAVTNANVFWSPWNWYSDGAGAMGANNVKASSTYVVSNTPGAYVKTKLVVPTGGGACYVNVDTTHHTGYASASNWPTLQYSVDGGTATTHLLASGETQVALGTLTAGTHTLCVWFKSIGEFNIDRWNGTPPPNSVKITGFEVPAGGSSAAPNLLTKRMLIFGDSIVEGLHNVDSGPSTNAGQNAGYTWAQFIATACDAEAGMVGFGGQTDNSGGIGNTPAGTTSYSLYSSGRSRLVGGLFSPQPDYIVVNWGENGVNNTAYTAVLANIRTAAPNALILLVDPFAGDDSLAGVTLPSGDSYRVDITGGDGGILDYYTGNQSPVHPTIQGSANIAARLRLAISEYIDGNASSFGSFAGASL